MKSTSVRLLTLLFLVLPTTANAQAPRIDPAGIAGAFLICGDGDVSPAAFDRFIDLAGGAKAKVAVIDLLEPDQAKHILDGVAKSAKAKNAAEPTLVAWKDAKKALPELTGVWISTKQDWPKWERAVKETPLHDELRAVLKRNGVVATSGSTSEILGPLGGFVLPGDLLDVRNSVHLPERRRFMPVGHVVFSIGREAALQIKGRTLSAVGPGTTTMSLYRLDLKKSSEPEIRTITLQGKAVEDLTALRRAAYDRSQLFPPKEVEAPVVEKGTLVIVGGGGSPDGLFEKFVEYAGGPDKANIVIFPTANPDPLPKRDQVAAAFKKAGARKATVLYGRTQAEVESKEFLDTLKEATGLWFDGGRQWRFVDCYKNTKALPLMFDVLKRGGVIGGTSAGATIQGDYLCRGGVFTNFDIRYEGYERGLGFLKGVAIDQHFTQRKRQPEMTQLMKIYPQYLGIGLDEATAIVVKGSVAEVIGKGKAHFYDARRKVEKGDPDYEALSAGARYDLKERKVLTADK
jgi:cyanophycinase